MWKCESAFFISRDFSRTGSTPWSMAALYQAFDEDPNENYCYYGIKNIKDVVGRRKTICRSM